MDMRSNFKLNVDGKEFEFTCETWQDAMDLFLKSLNQSGFLIDEVRHQRLVQLAMSGQVTIS